MGRTYIDRERLEVVGYQGVPEGYENTFDCGVMWLLEQIDEMPSADVQPVRHGHWIVLQHCIKNQSFDECKCSECGVVEYFNVGWKKFNYCPNCGARMDGEQDGRLH